MANGAKFAAARSMEAAIAASIDAVGRVTSWVTLAIVVLMTCNVLLRYTLNLGTVWAQELEWHMLGVLVLGGMSYALQKDDHVRVDLFYANFSARIRFLVDAVSLLLQLGICLIVIWLSLNYVGQSWSIGEISSDPGGLPFRWAVKALLPLGFALLSLQTIGALCRLWINYRDACPVREATHV